MHKQLSQEDESLAQYTLERVRNRQLRPAPSQQMFGRVMCLRYIQRKRGGKSCYFGVRLAA